MYMKQETGLPKRKKNRLEGYEYDSNGAYFITICVEGRKKILSRIVNCVGGKKNVGDGLPVPQMTRYGNIIKKHIEIINKKYPMVHVDKYVIIDDASTDNTVEIC